MGDNDLNIKIEIPKSVDKAIENITHAPTKVIGDTLGNVFFLVFGGISHAAEKRKLKYVNELKLFEKELFDSVSTIPEEFLQEPRMQLIAPALEDARYCLEEKTLRDMFTALITKTFDSRFNNLNHPSFSRIISQMSPLDAENLLLFKSSVSNCLPIAKYQFKTYTGGIVVKMENVFLENKIMINSENSDKANLSLVAQSLAALQSMGLIALTYSSWFHSKEKYLQFEKTKLYLELNKKVIPDLEAHKVVIIDKIDFRAFILEDDVDMPNVYPFQSLEQEHQDILKTVTMKSLNIGKGQARVTAHGEAFLRTCSSS